MTKTITIYGVQILLGLIALAAGGAKLSGTGLMVQQFQALGLGYGFLFFAGCAEIVAGICLMLPRGGYLGAVLLTSVVVGALGMTIGHVASALATPTHAAHYTISHHQAMAPGSQATTPIVIVRSRTAWDI